MVSKALLKLRKRTSTVLASSTRLVVSSQKAIELVWHDFLFIDPSWLLPVTFMSLVMFGNGFQDYLLHPEMSRDWGEAGQPVVPQFLLLAFLQGRSVIGFLPAPRNFSQLPWLFTDHWNWPGQSSYCITNSRLLVFGMQYNMAMAKRKSTQQIFSKCRYAFANGSSQDFLCTASWKLSW